MTQDPLTTPREPVMIFDVIRVGVPHKDGPDTETWKVRHREWNDNHGREIMTYEHESVAQIVAEFLRHAVKLDGQGGELYPEPMPRMILKVGNA